MNLDWAEVGSQSVNTIDNNNRPCADAEEEVWTSALFTKLVRPRAGQPWWAHGAWTAACCDISHWVSVEEVDFF